MRASLSFAPAPPPPRACICSRCSIGDKRLGQCRPSCQVTGPPLCRALTDSSPLTRFMGVKTFFCVPSNWNTVTAGPRPWPPTTGQLSVFVWKTIDPLWWIIYSRSLPIETARLFLSNQHVLSKRRCVFNQLLRENYLARAVERANIQVCQG